MRIMGKLMQVIHRTSRGRERISTQTEALSAANLAVSRKRKAAILEGELMWPAVSPVNKCFTEKVLMSMKEVDVKKIVLKDPVIMQYGERMFMKKDVQEHTPNYISSRMRIMGKLMQVLHRTSSGRERISTLTEAFNRIGRIS